MKCSLEVFLFKEKHTLSLELEKLILGNTPIDNMQPLARQNNSNGFIYFLKKYTPIL